jgi:hypothetical protein
MGWRQRWRRADRGRCPSAAGDTGKQLLHGKGGPETWAPLIRGADRWAKGKSEEMDGGIDLIRLGLNLSWERTKGEKRRTCGTMIKKPKKRQVFVKIREIGLDCFYWFIKNRSVRILKK